jgi:hypothetical protein
MSSPLVRLASCAGLVAVAAGCGGTNTCKDGTAFLTIAYDAVSDAADSITITVTVGSTSQSMDETHHAPAPNDTVEIDFASGYPAGQPFNIAVVAKKQGLVIGTGQRAGTLSPGCTGIGVSVGGTPDLQSMLQNIHVDPHSGYAAPDWRSS